MSSLSRQVSFDYLNTVHTVTFSLGWATAVACLGTLQFGYHLAELNGSQDILTCNFHRQGPYENYEDTIWSSLGRKQCIPMEESSYATTTTMFVIGGLISSILIGSHKLSIIVGRKLNCIINAGLFFLGSCIMTLANSGRFLNLGRLLAGLGAGSTVVISPILISELTPTNHRGFLGSFLQLSLAIGIFASQFVSLFWANDQQWRQIFMFASIIGLVQFILLFTIVESPKWLIVSKNDTTQATDILSSLRSNQITVDHEINHWRRLTSSTKPDEATPLIDDLVSDSNDFIPLAPTLSRRGSIDPSNVSLSSFLTQTNFRRELAAIIIIMSGNQLCGMNTITFYGVLFLKKIVTPGTNIMFLTSGLASCNVLSALLVAPLFDKLGRKPLLLTSAMIMAVASFLISMGLMNTIPYLTAGACFLFIFGYSIGLGPIVYLMVPEFTRHDAVGIGQSFGTVINWVSNIVVAYCFPYLQASFKGEVFFIFTVINLFYLITIWCYVPETKGLNSYESVWRSN